MLLPDNTPVKTDVMAHMKAVKVLLDRMDAGYSKTARGYGFQCDGCEDNCCETLFHHHTLAEYLFLQSGFLNLAGDEKLDIRHLAASVQETTQKAGDRSIRIMCPLNRDGMCRLYAHRPMICRLHGIPHELNHPLRGKTTGEGCDDFDRQCGQSPSGPLDRTPFYREMAQVESRLREGLCYRSRMKMTITHMILSWAPFAGTPQDKNE